MQVPTSGLQANEQEAVASARRSTFQSNLAYLHANIGYYLNLDVDQSQSRLNDISALIEVLLEQTPGDTVG